MRLIDADVVIKELRASYPSMPLFKELREEWAIKTNGYIKAENIIRFSPTLDAVEVVRGEWIDEHEGGHGEWVGTCNQCGKTARVGNFCPNCGARMEGADDE